MGWSGHSSFARLLNPGACRGTATAPTHSAAVARGLQAQIQAPDLHLLRRGPRHGPEEAGHGIEKRRHAEALKPLKRRGNSH